MFLIASLNASMMRYIYDQPANKFLAGHENCVVINQLHPKTCLLIIHEKEERNLNSLVIIKNRK
jgi:hypothetical protein